MKTNKYLILAVFYISFVTGGMASKIGDTQGESIIYWYDPLLVILILGLPFVLGYFAGRKDIS